MIVQQSWGQRMTLAHMARGRPERRERRSAGGILLPGQDRPKQYAGLHTFQAGQFGRTNKAAAGGGGTPDPELLLHFNGADGSTTFTDSSLNGHTVTANGNAQLDTAQSQYGGSSLLLDGTGDYANVTLASHNYTTGTIFIGFWWRWNGAPALAPWITLGVGGDSFYFQWIFNSIYVGDGSNNVIAGVAFPGATADTWHHFAYTHTAPGGSDTHTVFADGNSLAAGGGTLSTGAQTVMNIGARTAQGWYCNGWMDDLVVIYGDRVYTANFTPPAEWPNP
jgi:hypothetical protein